MRSVRLAIALAMGAALTSCASHPWWYQSGESSCGPTYMLRLHGQVGSYGGCTGALVEPPPILRLHVGDHFDIHVDTTPPTITTDGVLRRTALDYDTNLGDSTLSFDAVRAGSTDLTYLHTYCTSKRTHRQRTGACPLLEVVVTATSAPDAGGSTPTAIATSVSGCHQAPAALWARLVPSGYNSNRDLADVVVTTPAGAFDIVGLWTGKRRDAYLIRTHDRRARFLAWDNYSARLTRTPVTSQHPLALSRSLKSDISDCFPS